MASRGRSQVVHKTARISLTVVQWEHSQGDRDGLEGYQRGRMISTQRFLFYTMFLFRPGGLGRSHDVPLVSFAFRMRVIEHVALQTQPLDAGEALGVDWSNATDSADLCKEEEMKNKR